MLCVYMSAGKIHVSESTYTRLQATEQFQLDYRGEIPVKVRPRFTACFTKTFC